MATPRHSAAPEHLPWFITAPADTDVLYVITAVAVVVSVVLIGVAFFWLHSLPERMSHKKTQFEVVAVLGLISLFTHMHIFWIAGLLLAVIDLPDFISPVRRIANATSRIAGSGAAPFLAIPRSLPVNPQPQRLKGADEHQSLVAQPVPAKARKRRIAAMAALAAVAAGILLVMMADRWFQSPDDPSLAVQTTAPEQHANQKAAEETPAVTTPERNLVTADKDAPASKLEQQPETSADGTKADTAPEAKPVMPDGAAPDDASVAQAERAQEPAAGTSSPAGSPGDEGRVPQPEDNPVPPEASQTAAPPEMEPAPEAVQPPPAESGKAMALTVDSADIDNSGRAVIAGRATPGSEITAKLDGRPIGRTRSNADGVFVLVPDAPLPKGTSKLTLESGGADGPTAAVPTQTVDVNVAPQEQQLETGTAATTNAESAAPQEPEPRTAEPILGAAESADADTTPEFAPSEAAAPADTARRFEKRSKVRKQKEPDRRTAEAEQRGAAASEGELPESSKSARRTRKLKIVRTWIETRCDRRLFHCVTRVRYLRKRVTSGGD